MLNQNLTRVIRWIYLMGVPLGISLSLILLSSRAVQGQGSPPLTAMPDIEAMNAGLIKATSGPCAGIYEIPGLGVCTTGFDSTDDTPNTGPVPPIDPDELTTQSAVVQCDGDGVAGNRIQVIYAHPPERDRYTQYLASFQQWMADMDTIFNASAAETGGTRHVRFVHDAGCTAVVLNVQVSSTAMSDSLPFQMWNELESLGYNRSDRKYVVFADTTGYTLGISSFLPDDRLSADNAANVSTGYTSTPFTLWGGSNPAHELMHSLGGVQSSAPHGAGGGHCTDEYDRMCYGATTIVCSDPNHEYRFDCNHDDYYHTNPPLGSYLASHWNPANSSFLIGATPFRKTWTGATDTNWTTGGNWSSNYAGASTIPVQGDECYIPAGAPRYPIISGTQPLCGTLIVEAGASVFIEDGLTANTAVISGNVEVRNGGYLDAGSSIVIKPTGRLLFQNADTGSYFLYPDGILTVEGTLDVTGTAAIHAGFYDPGAVEPASAHLLVNPTGVVNIVPGGNLIVDGTITNNGTLKETKNVAQNTTTSFLTWNDKYYGLDITLPAGGNMGSTLVEIKGNQACPEASVFDDTIKRCYTITPTTAQNATVKFYYRPNEGALHLTPFAYHFNGATWGQLASTRGGSGEARFVQATGVSAYSPFALLDPTVRISRSYLPLIVK
jgi:hypothetical protein